jgi:urease accessory protein
MQTSLYRGLLLAALGVAGVSEVMAHTGVGTNHSFIDGMLHPFLGADHLLVLLGVGVWGVRLGRRAFWQLPLTFMLALTFGAGYAVLGFALPWAELAVALTVFALGLLLIREHDVALPIAFLFASVSGGVHGYVHLQEVSGSVALLDYGAGLAIGNVALLGVGVCSGKHLYRSMYAGFGWLCAGLGAVGLLSL